MIKKIAYWASVLVSGCALAFASLVYFEGPTILTVREQFAVGAPGLAPQKREMQLASTSTVAVAPVPEAQPSPWRTEFVNIVRTWGELQVLKRDEEDARDTAQAAERVIADFRERAVVGRIAISGILDVELREKLIAEFDEEEKRIVALEQGLPGLYIFLARLRNKLAAHERTLSVELTRRPRLLHFLQGWPDSRASLETKPPPPGRLLLL